ncbi:hypothetical protein BpHYR1_053702 [Brachionus plicatilis]|uniref:Uncharacterized protein n=1 Tax=Brachionus plicatilis TaxID=10195 RepID=A0A3M7Q0H0_BRAPC|nr:hypothetical protein BpHYR1_053702 [Brachionus plicatilis]
MRIFVQLTIKLTFSLGLNNLQNEVDIYRFASRKFNRCKQSNFKHVYQCWLKMKRIEKVEENLELFKSLNSSPSPVLINCFLIKRSMTLLPRKIKQRLSLIDYAVSLLFIRLKKRISAEF